MQNGTLGIFVCSMVLGIGFFACSGDDTEDPGQTTTSSTTTTGTTASSSTSSTTTSNTGGGGEGGTCMNNDVEGVAPQLVEVPDPCALFGSVTDGYDASDTESAAEYLGCKSDDAAAASSVTGVLSGIDDEDWYVFWGEDTFDWAGEAPVRGFVPPDQNLKFCAYYACDVGLGDTEVECPTGTTSTNSEGGRPGCCAESPMLAIDMASDGNFNCGGSSNEDSLLYFQISAGPGLEADACIPYEIHFDF